MSKSSDGPSTPARRGVRTRHVLVAAGILTLGVAPFGVAATGDALREGKRNGTTRAETQIISNISSTTAQVGGYSTRQSNLSSTGGGAIYGCRSGAGSSATNPPRNPCVRANNLSNGQAFEFASRNGATVGSITAGGGGDAKKPFTTNATGVATGLNADRVDNLDAAQIVAAAGAAADAKSLFAQVGADGTAGATRGVTTGGVTNPAGVGTYSVVFSGDRSRCAFSTAIAGAEFGHIRVTPTVAAGNTTVVVNTANAEGVPADRAFHLTATC